MKCKQCGKEYNPVESKRIFGLLPNSIKTCSAKCYTKLSLNFDNTVCFRKFSENEIIALFPYVKELGCIKSYMHVGQHCPASPDLVDKLKPANKEEYEELFDELRTIGYINLNVIP